MDFLLETEKICVSLLGLRSQVVDPSFQARADNRKNGQKHHFAILIEMEPFDYTL